MLILRIGASISVTIYVALTKNDVTRIRCTSSPRCGYVYFEQVKPIALRWRSLGLRYAYTKNWRFYFCYDLCRFDQK